ncbi:arginine--tRNA ligase [Ignavigranum ruoffiae]|uniref:arginine--tRNA ligase n=1 Tax=Ignavigranum ruoffiae TaxID=89093 RepID=UPI002059F8EC|nr:arginine--tRNA ligase [Ignavigranum ruoffiae]UPQ85018.1 arginine--tRNA ligase [Ignavigranum ruoffiae]
MENKKLIVEALTPVLEGQMEPEQIESLIEIPSNPEHGDFAFPVFQLAKVFRKAPQMIASELVEKIDDSNFDKVVAVGPYINFLVKRSVVSNQVLHDVLAAGANYGDVDLGHGGNACIDMSSPNIAKPMSMGHLRSTVIGNSIANILDKVNYNTIKINHLGDWGTQFGKLIVAYKKWGDENVVKQDPVNELVKLYVQFHEEAETDPELDDQARAAFKKLEEHDPEMTELWQWFKEESLKEFNKVYEMLDIDFDSYNGEAFYNDKMDPVIQELEDKGISTIENGATIVLLEEENLPPALIKKSDGATLYLTRDLATAYYRHQTYDFDQNIYVVGNEQANHFKQLKAVLKRLGNDWSDDMHHIPFGLITLEGKKLSTRKGKIVLLEEVLKEAIELALEQIKQKNPDLENKEEVARQVGVGAVIFHDLKSDRLNSFDFKLDEIVQFEGETGPYIQYACARANTILEKYGKEVNSDHVWELTDAYSWEIIKKLSQYQATVIQAAERYEPSVIAKYAIQLAQLFNRYYGNTRILSEDDQLEARIALVQAIVIVLKDALSLLGIKAPENM